MKLKTIESLQKKVRKKNTNKRVQGKNYKIKKKWGLILKYTQSKGIVLKF
jgi:hypothetical protein